jgi:hypothetical protein
MLGNFNELPLRSLELAPDYRDFPWGKFFRLPDGATATPEQQQEFESIWKAGRLLPPGRDQGGLLPGNDKIDGMPTLLLTDKALEVRVPCELPVPGSAGRDAYRARIVVACSDPAVLAELKQLHDQADPDRDTVPPPETFRKNPGLWRITAIECDLVRVSTRPPEQQGGEGTPGVGG